MEWQGANGRYGCVAPLNGVGGIGPARYRRGYRVFKTECLILAPVQAPQAVVADFK
jgi:hypothetical protein